MTAARGTCEACGAVEPVGATHVYLGAGVVVHCPHCDHVLAKIVRSETRIWIDLGGMRTLEIPRDCD